MSIKYKNGVDVTYVLFFLFLLVQIYYRQ